MGKDWEMNGRKPSRMRVEKEVDVARSKETFLHTDLGQLRILTAILMKTLSLDKLSLIVWLHLNKNPQTLVNQKSGTKTWTNIESKVYRWGGWV